MKENVIGIYKITNLINMKTYIGQSRDIFVRFRNHKSSAFNQEGKSFDNHLYRSIRKYGLDNFSFDIIEECSIEKLNDREIFWINYYNSNNSKTGYNQSMTGFLQSPLKLTEKELIGIKQMLSDGYSYLEIIKIYPINRQMVSQINTGTAWFDENQNYSIKKHQDKDIGSFSKVCIRCLIKIDNKSTRCVSCNNIWKRENSGNLTRPSPIELATLVKEYGFVGVGKMFNVSDNAIKKWCKSYGIPHLKKELILWLDHQ